ncbi:2-oxoglutarate and iron-dependent oxygenase domain-containing protein 3 isoform X1 [Pteropus vampyrus]|uniref:2-oxoglutarate and iron-dependent oxygenase domain-containing protein 3 isoform X1 n=1 Tax=Pteropus vampyrus TaxID=132908 RepID=A0A6P3QZX3_PTEVA|nr:2-oxoglutarate and iron-dependent oxygenase domain-containing protein 3 isoform X1 [Pteropus vampyrus]
MSCTHLETCSIGIICIAVRGAEGHKNRRQASCFSRINYVLEKQGASPEGVPWGLFSFSASPSNPPATNSFLDSRVHSCSVTHSVKSARALRELRRKWLRAAGLGTCAALAALLLWGILGADDGVTEVLAHRGEVLPGRFIEVPCSEDYDSHRRFEGCSPTKCGRGVTDAVISRDEARRIRSIAEKGLSLGGSDGGASILDLHSGALSVGKHFVNLYRYFGDKIENIFSEEDFQLYRDVRQKVQLAVARAFGVSASSLHLTKPTFFSRINSTEARTAHDEYWHAHVDKVTYGSFDYTSLLYLSDYLDDFGGGRFVFVEEGANTTVEPRAGRVSFFTSGSENLHRVEKVHWGTRYAITIAFTCNPDLGIADPALT